ncbi:MAG: rhomboid family intramembrane serine protease [Deltaproteobacteria bacterium]|nr:rhomboid family intramembrane serine protease [Deltaproteobacteria bacterium]
MQVQSGGDRKNSHQPHSRRPVLKKGLDEITAQRYKHFLDRLGLLCDVVCETPPQPAPSLVEEPEPLLTREEAAPKPAGRSCPKCFTQGQTGDICTRCGLLFSRFDEIQKRRAENPQPQPEPGAEKSHFDRHPEQLFILKAFGVILVILLVRDLLSNFMGIIFMLFPIGFLLYIRLQAASSDRSATELLAENITFMPVMYSKEERAQEYLPKVTYSLIAANILIFYLFELHVDPKFIWNNLIFLPYQPNFLNVPISAVTAMFLHASNAHLWGNMLFLWAVGTVVERRIGPLRFGLFYLVSGIVSHLSYLLASIIIGSPAHSLGASGAIAGIMGVFAVRCYFKSMVFPLPILGIFSLVLPISLKVRLNSLVIIGLFFLANLSGSIQQLAGAASSNVNHLAHIGGMLCGIVLATVFKLNEDAVMERHMELGIQAVNADIGSGIGGGEESLNLLLKKDPENIDALLLLARLRTKFAATEEGDQLYRKVIPMLARSNPEEAMITFHEYYNLYMKPLDADTMYRLANIFHQQKDYEMSSRCLEMICGDKNAPAPVLEKALFQCGRTFETMGLSDVARQYYQRCIDSFPDSTLSAKAKVRLSST